MEVSDRCIHPAMIEAFDRERYEQQEQVRQDKGIINCNVYNVI